MNTVDRRARERLDVQEKILGAARELFIERGYQAVTMRQIADAIEYTPGAIYVYFKDKQELMLALCRHDFASFEQALHDIARDESNPLAKINKMGEAYLHFAYTHPRHYELMFMTKFPPGVQLSPEEIARLQDPNFNAYAFLAQCVHQAMSQGLFRSELTDPLLVTQTLWAGMHGVATIGITFAEDPTLKLVKPHHKASAEMRRTLLLGLVRDPSLVAPLFAHARGPGGAL